MGGKDFDGFCNVEIVHLTNSKIKCSILPGSALDQPLDLPIGEGCFGGFFNGKIFVGGGRHNRKYPNYYQIFGMKNFQSEIIWSYKRWSNSKKGLLNSHQNIYFYSE